MPKEYALYQNYPNPFNPVTNIEYGIPQRSKVQLIIYDMLGREVRQLVNNEQPPNFYRIEWNGNNSQNQSVSSGIYIYRMIAESINTDEQYVQTRKMLLLK